MSRRKKKSFVLYESHWKTIQQVYETCGGDKLYEFMHAIFELGIARKHTPFESSELELAFVRIQEDIEENQEAYDETVRQRSEAGKIGAEKRWNIQDMNAFDELFNKFSKNNDSKIACHPLYKELIARKNMKATEIYLKVQEEAKKEIASEKLEHILQRLCID